MVNLLKKYRIKRLRAQIREKRLQIPFTAILGTKTGLTHEEIRRRCEEIDKEARVLEERLATIGQ